ncbi:hypothetical protein EDB89DRAFT_1901412 [Lactarius sanguifluus]|nr:hypothetical protein EDB89DRAFT_1901412 [Lactarius sanguifluus]
MNGLSFRASHRSHTTRKRNRTERANGFSLTSWALLLRTRLGHKLWVRTTVPTLQVISVRPAAPSKAQDDPLNPERRADLSAEWACLEWSGLGPAGPQRIQGVARRYGRVPDKRLADCIIRSPRPLAQRWGAGGELRRPSTPWGKRGYSSRKLHDGQGSFPHKNEKGLFPQSAHVYSATDGDEKTTHFYQENTGFETNRVQIMCLLEERHEQWTTRILDVMLGLGSALLQPNVSDEGSRGGNAPSKRFRTVRPWTTSKRTIGRDATARSSRNIGVLYLAIPVHNMQTTGTGRRGSRDQAVGVADLGIRLPRWPCGSYKARRVYSRRSLWGGRVIAMLVRQARGKCCRKEVVSILDDVTSPLLWAAASKLSSRPKRKEDLADRTP